MTRALGSIWPRSAPCRAQVGSAWCRLCQDSPNDRMASHHTLRDWSREPNCLRPNTWHTELIDQVTWCSSDTRTRLAQKKALSAPAGDQVTRPPIRPGSVIEVATSQEKASCTLRTARSAIKSGA